MSEQSELEVEAPIAPEEELPLESGEQPPENDEDGPEDVGQPEE